LEHKAGIKQTHLTYWYCRIPWEFLQTMLGKTKAGAARNPCAKVLGDRLCGCMLVTFGVVNLQEALQKALDDTKAGASNAAAADSQKVRTALQGLSGSVAAHRVSPKSRGCDMREVLEQSHWLDGSTLTSICLTHQLHRQAQQFEREL